MKMKTTSHYILLSFFLAILGKSVFAENLPCMARQTDAGYVCVCDGTYCDTIEAPSPLSRGLYYHYSTSKDSPGFTARTGEFLNTPLSNSSSNDIYIWVNSSIEYQTMEGFGASFTGSSGMMINSLSSAAKKNFIESYFGPLGLEYTFARVPIAAADFSPEIYTYDDVPGDVDLKYFNLTEEDYQMKIPIIKMAMDSSKRGLKLLGTTWTAPYWMKTNNALKMGFIHNKYLNTWANYYLKFLQAYKQFGIDFWGVTQGNEVMIAMYFGPWFPIQNTVFPPYQARFWTKKYLGPLLTTSGFEKVKILALDDERPFMVWYADRLFADKDAGRYIDGFGVHWYLDSDSNIQNLDIFHQKYPDKFILYTESSINFFNGGGAVKLGAWSSAVKYITNIIQNLNHWVIGYLDWNIALNEDGGPTGPGNMTLDAAVIINKTSGEFYKQPLFYILGHFSKFIHPGAKKINVTTSQNSFDDSNNVDFSINKIFESSFDESTGDPPPSTEGPPPPTGGPPPPTGGPTPTGVPPPTGGPPPPTGGPPPPTGRPSSTSAPFPTRQPEPEVTDVIVLATSNPDGSHTVIAYNPKSDQVNLIIEDSVMGVLNQTVEANSLNTFVYW